MEQQIRCSSIIDRGIRRGLIARLFTKPGGKVALGQSTEFEVIIIKSIVGRLGKLLNILQKDIVIRYKDQRPG